MRLLSFIGLITALAVAACAPDAGSAPATTTAPASSPRIVSLVPAATLNLVLMHLTDSLVGGTTFDKPYLPDGKKNLPVVGDYEELDYEALASLHPTAVIIQKAEPRIEPRLREMAAADHIELANIRLDKIDDIWTTVRTLARIAGHPDAADKPILLAQARLKLIADEYAGEKNKPRVVYLAGPDSMMIAGHDILGEMIDHAGGINAGAEVGQMYPIISIEGLVKLAPEVLLIGDPGQPPQEPGDPRLAQWLTLPIPAAAQRRIYLITDPDSQIPALDIGKNVQEIAELIHFKLPPPTATATSQPGAAP